MELAVLGTGLIGQMIVRELGQRDFVRNVLAVDGSEAAVERAVAQANSPKVSGKVADLGTVAGIEAVLEGVDIAVGALPDSLSLLAVEAAAKKGVHLIDLVGANYDRKLPFHEVAVANDALIVPGAGLAPGIVNVLAARGIDLLDEADSAIMYCGGLPQHPLPPLDYQLVFSLVGVMGLYTRPAMATQDGEIVEMPPMAGLEDIDFPEPIGRLEAAYSDAHSTAYTLAHKVKHLAEKTLRYDGHFGKMAVLLELGFLDNEPVDVDGVSVSPQALAMKLLEPRMRGGSNEDVVVLRVDVAGTKAGEQVLHRWELIDRFDPETGYTAMARTTGFPALMAVEWLAAGKLRERGLVSPEEIFVGERFDAYVAELAAHGVRIEEVSKANQ